VTDDLSASQSNAPNCIEVAASGARLNLDAHSLTGNGTGIGVLIRHGADHVVVQGKANSGQAYVLDDDPCATTGQGIVTGWNVAVEDDGDYAVIELFSQLGGAVGGNATAGILLNGVHGSLASNFNACDNGVAGVIVRNSSLASLTNYTVAHNTQSGVWSDSSNDSTYGACTSIGNGKYGYWLMRSSRNVILDANGTAMNGDTGILIGCGAQHCAGNETSDNNRVTNSGSSANTNAGIVIERHNHNNMIVNTSNGGNPDGFDLVDLNPNCDSNIWYNNLGTSNQECIH
jgi:hypothetical protein